MAQGYHKLTHITKIVILLLIVVTVFFVIFNRPKNHAPKKINDGHSSAQITVTDSVFSSIGDNSYKISAKHVKQSEDGIYELRVISGVYHLDNDSEIDMKAKSGKFDTILDVAHLENDVKINYLGYDLTSEILDLDLKHYSASSSQNVHLDGIGGSIDADSFKTTDKFNQIIFHGDVKADFVINNTNKR